jgi:hypothetical protein
MIMILKAIVLSLCLNVDIKYENCFFRLYQCLLYFYLLAFFEKCDMIKRFSQENYTKAE